MPRRPEWYSLVVRALRGGHQEPGLGLVGGRHERRNRPRADEEVALVGVGAGCAVGDVAGYEGLPDARDAGGCGEPGALGGRGVHQWSFVLGWCVLVWCGGSG